MRVLLALTMCCICIASVALASEPAQQKDQYPNDTKMKRDGAFRRMKPTKNINKNRRNTTRQEESFKSFSLQQTAGNTPYRFPPSGKKVSIEDLPSGRLTDSQITNLFLHKIVKGTHLRRGFSFKRHFRLDGFLIEQSPQRGEHIGYWRANQDCLCIRWENKRERCSRIIKENGKINQYGIRKSGTDAMVVTFEEFVSINDGS